MKIPVFQQLSITKKLTVFYVLVFSLSLFFISAGILYSVEAYQLVTAHADMQRTKQAIVNFNQNNLDLNEEINLNANKNIFMRFYKDDAKIIESEGFVYDFPEKQPQNIIESHDDNEQHYLTETVSFEANNAVYTLQLVKNMDSEKVFLKLLFMVIAIMDVLGIGVSVLLGYLFSKRMLKPVGEITRAAQKINAQNLSERILLPPSKDELYMMAETFNEMSDRLQKSFQQQSQFVSDASHELKTPISVIKGYINLLDRWGKDDKEALDTSIEAIKNETENMEHLVSKLLTLAKLDTHQPITMANFDLAVLGQSLVKEIELYDTTHAIFYQGESHLSITSNESMIKQLIRILCDNASKFTPAGGNIHLSCIKEKGKGVLMVADTGCGIENEEIPHIFNRFYTENPARNKEKSGNGLGLSIAKDICDALDARIFVSSKMNEGTEFKIVFG